MKEKGGAHCSEVLLKLQDRIPFFFQSFGQLALLALDSALLAQGLNISSPSSLAIHPKGHKLLTMHFCRQGKKIKSLDMIFLFL